MWERFAGLFGGPDPDNEDDEETTVIDPADQGINPTAEGTQPRIPPLPTLEADDYDSGLISGRPSHYEGPVQLGQDREQALANAAVLGAEGELIRRLLGEVEQSPAVTRAGDDTLAEVEVNLVEGGVRVDEDASSVADETPRLLVTPVESPGPVLPPLALESSSVSVTIDVESEDDVSASVVLVVSPGSTGTGTVIDDSGHVLTNWHVVKDSPTVLVIPKQPDAASPDAERVLLAKVVRLNRFSDLALLKVLDRPDTLQPVAIAPTPRLERGQTIHAIGHPNGAAWRHTVAKVNRMKSKGTWHSGNNLTPRGSLISAEVRGDAGESGAPLFNDHLQLVGISTAKGNRPGQLNALSLESILQFLGEQHGGSLVVGD